MRIFFSNPNFSLDQWDGARVHVTQLVHHLTEQGHEVWTLPLYRVERARVLPHAPIPKFQHLRTMDACYLRIEGTAPCLSSFFRPPLRLLTRSIPLVWELNSTPELGFRGRADQDLGMHEAKLARLARDTALAICNTQGLAQFAADLGVPATLTVPLGSDPALFRPDLIPDPTILREPGVLNVLWCGNAAVRWHDLECMLEAAAILDGRAPIRFFMVTKSLPVAGPLPKNLTVLPPRPYFSMPQLLTAMDVGLAIYTDESWSRYGTFSSPLKVFDYLASGLTLVGSPIEQIKKLHEECPGAVQLVPFAAPSVLAERLGMIARHSGDRLPRNLQGRALVTTYYNWSRVATETAAAIGSL